MGTHNRIAPTSDLTTVFRPRPGLYEFGLSSALLLLVLFVFFHNLGGAALFEPDEGRNAEVAREILATGDWVTPHYDFVPRLDKPIPYYWAVALCYKLFGVSEWSARFPSAVAALACVLLTSALALTIFGFWEALWSGLILTTGVEFFVLARTVILDMTLAFFLTLALCAFYWAATRSRALPKRRLYLLMYLAIGVAALLKGPIGIILPALVILSYGFHTRKWFLLNEMHLISGAALSLVLASSWYLWAEMKNPGYLRYFFLEENILRFLTADVGHSQPGYYFFAVLSIGFLPWTLLLTLVVRDCWERPLDDATVFLANWVVVPLLFFSLSNSKLPHYVLPVYPPLSIIAGRSLHRILRDPRATRGWVLSLPWVTLAAAFLVFLVALLKPDALPHPIVDRVGQFGTAVSFPVLWVGFLIPILLASVHWPMFWKRPAMLYLSYCLGFFLSFLIAHRVVAEASRTRTSKALAEHIAPLIDSEDRLVVFHAYPSSLPFYLQIERPLWVVWSGKRGPVLGSRYVGAKLPLSAVRHEQVLFTYEQFSRLWRESRERILVLIRSKDLERLSQEGVTPVKTVAESGDVVLVTNR
ncbi:MAG TPA: glycosyltransferase family 39 protein [Candidatus Eisenbacteria bacterium]|nr:glycosyltransferase family 39 protein [Candidatus Eisenbacteria bacterium]